MANESKQVFSSATTVISHAATLANAANTYSGLTGLTMTQLDNSTTAYPLALAVLNITDTFAAAPSAGSTIDFYVTVDDVDGTTDETPLPAATDILHLAKYAGSFVLDNQDVAIVKPLTLSLEGILKAQGYIYNGSGQTISYSATATTVKVTPFSYGPT